MKKIFSFIAGRFAYISIGVICGIVILSAIVFVSQAGTFTASSWTVSSNSTLSSSKFNSMVSALATAINDNNTYAHFQECSWSGWNCKCITDKGTGTAKSYATTIVSGVYCNATYHKIASARIIVLETGGEDNTPTCSEITPKASSCTSWTLP